MEEIIAATRSPHGYLVSPLTDNISETDEGYLIIVGCPIARTGFQEYSVRDLPQDDAKQLGVDISNPTATIDLYRPAEEVFAREFLASLNGKPITDNHPENFLDKDSARQHQMGHIQNPRKGTEALDDGEWPLIADLVITAEPLISKVRNRTARDISLGYDYSIRRDGNKICQCDMFGNHAAVVPKGRAGDYVSIKDAAPDDIPVKIGDDGSIIPIADPDSGNPRAAPPEPAAVKVPPAPSAQDAAIVNAPHQPTLQKEKRRVKNPLHALFGRGLQTMAQDANTDPEDIAQAALEFSKTQQPDRARAADAADDKAKDKGKGKDDLGDPPDKDHPVEAVDTKRKKMHDALDLMMDKKGKDTDIGELKSLLDEYLSEEEGEPEHTAEDEPGSVAPLEEVIKEETDSEGEPGEAVVESGEEELEPEGEDAAEPDMECAHCGEDMAGGACKECGCRDGKAKDRRKGKDRARAADGAMAVLKIMRPFVARSHDHALKQTFNSALETISRSSVASNGGYDKFASVARARDKAGSKPARVRAADSGSGGTGNDDAIPKLQAAYDSAFKGGK